MTTDPQDAGPPASTLWITSCVLGLFAAVGFFRLLFFLGDVRPPGRVELTIWLALVTISAVFSAACAVLVGVKKAEARISQGLQAGGRHTS